MPVRMILGSLVSLVAALVIAGCAAPTDDDAPSTDSSYEDFSFLQSAPLADSDMHLLVTPKGMPTPYVQPDDTGILDEHGMCGPTAVANALLLYGIELTPQQAYDDGVHWLVGTMGTQIEDYMTSYQPQLGCSLEHPDNGAGFLRAELDSKHPVMVWFNMLPDADSHWVVVVAHQGTGATEQAIVMSWGRYYTIDMAKLTAAWQEVYGIRNPAVVCSQKTTLLP